jgi:hypothetical protein
MTDADMAGNLRDRAASAEQSVERLRSIGEGEMADEVLSGASLLRLAATRIECGPLERPEPGGLVTMTEERIWGIAFAAAGAASTPFMRDHPQYVMPSEEIGEQVTRVLAEMGFTDPPLGYRVAAKLDESRELGERMDEAGDRVARGLREAARDQTDEAIAARERTRRRMEGGD